MKKLLIAALLVVGMSSFAQEANDKPNRGKMENMTPEQRSERRLNRMATDLGLNADQQAKLKVLFAEQEAKRTSSADASKDERKAFKTQMDDRMKAILTPEQLEKWNANNEKMRARREGNGGYNTEKKDN